ncbi:transposase [Paraburkholderia sp. GAS448]|uniref:hypothetical protein n=1 Tax=Paraburkholderia sp. GAS448 TaxID=3035136 RepID=UPI003D1A5927
MNRTGCQAAGDEVAALLAVMTPDENYSTDALAARLGWTMSTTRMMIHAAQDTGVLWQNYRGASSEPILWVRRERKREPSMAPGKQMGVLQDYEREWRTFRDLCMLTRTR